MAPISNSNSRERVIDFTSPFYVEKFIAIYKKSEPSAKLQIYLKPLTWEVWVGVCASVILVAFIINVFVQCSLGCQNDESQFILNFPQWMWLTYQTIVKQGKRIFVTVLILVGVGLRKQFYPPSCMKTDHPPGAHNIIFTPPCSYVFHENSFFMTFIKNVCQ